MSCERVRLVELGFDRDLEADFEAVAPPTPGPGEVLVRVRACGVCHRDLIDRAGRFAFIQLPRVPGHEAAGEVVAVGAGTSWAVGDRVATMHRDSCGTCAACEAGDVSLCQSAAHVLGLLADGGYARWLVVPGRALFRVPADMAWTDAAVMHCTFGTAWRSLVTAGGLRAGERVLVTGANGGVGAAAVQIASALGAEVVAQVRDARHVAFLEGLGASRVVVDTTGRVHKQGVAGIDLALDCVGSPTFNGALRTLRVGGRVVVVGNVSEVRTELNVGLLIVFGLRIIGAGGATPEDMAALFAQHAARPFVIPVEETLPLEQADAAQRRVRAGGLQGRLVLEMA